MVGMASDIIAGYPDFAYCPGKKVAEVMDDMPSLPAIFTADGLVYDSEPVLPVIISVVDANCYLAMAETVTLARQLEEHNDRSLVVISPVGEVTGQHRLMDRMFTGTLYFLKDGNWLENTVGSDIQQPFFMKVEHGNVVKTSHKRAGILE
jgi:hypothetical protein